MLNPLAAQFGLSMKFEGGNFTETDYTLSLKFTILTDVGAPADFARKAQSVGLPPDCWHQTFIGKNSKRYRIVDINTRNRKYKLIAEGVVDDKRWKLPVAWATHAQADLG